MDKKRLLFVTQELKPYTDISEMSEIIQDLLLEASGDFEVRILMPRFGTINERRHRLHEVVRLSGMNIIVDDNDYPLIIKVASLPNARLQVYFLDNEEFFKRKKIFKDANGKPFEDNPERMIFFCKGVVETVKKFGWAPDIIYCHGWMTSLLPLYIKKTYEAEPLFQNSKIVYSAFDEIHKEPFTEEFIEKASLADLDNEDIEAYWEENSIKLHTGAAKYSDALIIDNEHLNADILQEYENMEIPMLAVNDSESFMEEKIEFLNSLVEEEEEETV